jgi:apolipoprotein N-acyltransferase
VRVTPIESSESPSKLARVWPWFGAVLSGLLLTLCFPGWNQGWLCWIALTPLAAGVFSTDRPWRRAALGYVAGYVFFAGTFWWLSSLAALYRNPFLLTIPLLLALYLGLFLAFWAWFIGAVFSSLDPAGRFGNSLRNLALGAAGASAWVAHEWVRERLFGGFGWNQLGVALHADLPMIQIAEFTGTPGLSWLVAFTNLMAVIIVRRIAAELGPSFSKRIRWEFSATMAIIALVFAFGIRRLLHPEAVETVPLRVVPVQANIPQSDKFDPEAADRVMDDIVKYTKLAADGQPGAQLIVLPESAIPDGGLFADERTYLRMMDVMQRGDFSLLLGTIDFDPAAREDYNTALLLSGRGSVRQSYRKMHLVPFGEYLPLRPVFGPFLGQLVPGDFTPGREFTVLHMADPAVNLAALVCFEDTLGDLTRHFVQRGAQVLVNITNDGWFGRTPAAEQQLANSTLRAVENRRPLVRCGNTGITCTVLPTGKIDRRLPPFEQRIELPPWVVPVPMHAALTFYTQHGDWLSWVSMGVVGIGVFATTVRRRRSGAAP